MASSSYRSAGGRPGGVKGDHDTAQPRADGFVQPAAAVAGRAGPAGGTQTDGLGDQAGRDPERDEARSDRPGPLPRQREVVAVGPAVGRGISDDGYLQLLAAGFGDNGPDDG